MRQKNAHLNQSEKIQILTCVQQDKSISEIANFLNIHAYTIIRFLKRFEETRSVSRRAGSGRPSKINFKVLAHVNRLLENNDELSSIKVAQCLKNDSSIDISPRTAIRARFQLGWEYKSTRYAQNLRPKNVLLRREYAKKMILRMQNEGYDFGDNWYADESKIMVDPYKRKSLRRKGSPVVYKGRHKHPISVMVWGAISKRGQSKIYIFTGIMDGPGYTKILEQCLLPVANALYPRGNWKLYQDNDPKHNSNFAKQWYEDNGVVWDKSPAESPDLNPIEMIWAEMKRHTKPARTLGELIRLIKDYWYNVLTPETCRTYINHLRNAIPQVYERDGYQLGR